MVWHNFYCWSKLIGCEKVVGFDLSAERCVDVEFWRGNASSNKLSSLNVPSEKRRSFGESNFSFN